MGLLQTRNLGNGIIYTIGFPYDNGIIYTNPNNSSSSNSTGSLILSEYTLVTKSGESNFYAQVKKNGNLKEYIINSPSYSGTDMIVRYDPSDENPSFAYYNYVAPNYYLHYSKLSNETWSNISVGNIGPSGNNDSIDLQYDPNDNLPACISYDSTNYDLNYYKYDGSSFVKTIISNGASAANNINYATLLFDPSDNYPLVHFIQDNSSILKSAKYNGSSWTITNVNTLNSGDNKRYAVSKIDERINQPVILMAGNTTGTYINIRSSNNIWLSGEMTDRQNDIIYQKPQLEQSLYGTDYFYISYIEDKDKLVFKEQYINEINWSPSISSYGKNPIDLLSGTNYIDKTKNINLELDSDLQPIVFYKKDNSIKYIKNISNSPITINKTTFSGENILKSIDQSSGYRFGLDFFKDTLKVYTVGNKIFYEYKSPQVVASSKNLSPNPIPTAESIYYYNIKINPITNQPNFTTLGQDKVAFYYPVNPQRTSWTGLAFPSGNINFSGTNTKMTILGGGSFDFDKNTNQVIMSVLGYAGSPTRYGGALIKADSIPSSGYTYYNTPYSGNYVAETDFKVNPITNKYCLVTALDPILNYNNSLDSGVFYYEMDPITTQWIKTRVSQSYRQSSEIYLDFKSDGNPILAYQSLSQNQQTGYLNISEYNGTNWINTIIDSSDEMSYYFNSFKYNSGENYYGISYKKFSINNTGFYITNKGGIIQKYNLGNQTNSSRIPHLSFKRYKNEIKPFIFYYPNVGSYRYFQYLQDGAFVTGEFKNQLGSFDEGKQMIII
jgi:hypothetical protein